MHLVAKLLSFREHRALCHVNKAFRSVAEPFLYSKIQFTWQKNPDYYATPEQPPPIIEFLRTLFSCPQLVRYVKNLHLDGNAHDIHAFRWKLPKLERWVQSLRDGSIDAVVALLLARLPSLRALYLGPSFTRQTALIGMVLRSAICEGTDRSLPDFRHLQDVTLLRPQSHDKACDRKVKNTADLLPFFYLHNLQRMSAAIQTPDAWTWPAAHLPTPSNLTSLDLTCIREAYLGDVLAVTENLQTLRWDCYYDAGVHVVHDADN
ncbi:uncharacterized protein DSM5745_08024 [Aspergillus mulundensis]|uniref:F-box domain-containing protein n=1 Tax=Aspergillus mulundensis TaxID=1810919 RepID=A0A3D8R8X7_9EURO|nr:hypothetical protein DSM5745_08024 [Aspergillus mulundensis]RDW70513.1 hypothetical protein DSM5745_08024 [Aspergillus mulundensis]